MGKAWFVFLKIEFLHWFGRWWQSVLWLVYGFVLFLILRISFDEAFLRGEVPLNFYSLSLCLILFLGSVYRFEESFLAESKGQLFESLFLMRQHHFSFLIAKLASNFLFLFLFLIIKLLILIFFTKLSTDLAFDYFLFYSPIVLGLSVVGTLAASLTLIDKTVGRYLAIFVYPLMFPLIMAGLKGMAQDENGFYIELNWLYMVFAFDGLFLFLFLILADKFLFLTSSLEKK